MALYTPLIASWLTMTFARLNFVNPEFLFVLIFITGKVGNFFLKQLWQVNAKKEGCAI